jgi:thiamine kinase-like enzyme
LEDLIVELDKKLEALLTKKISLEKLKIEEEAIKTWKERIEQAIIKSNDFRSLETNIKNLLKFMETRLKTLHSEIQDLV